MTACDAADIQSERFLTGDGCDGGGNLHEVSLVHDICTAVAESAREHGVTRVCKISLVVGSDCMVSPDALLFAFDHLKANPLTPDAVLEIQERPGRAFFIDHFEGER